MTTTNDPTAPLIDHPIGGHGRLTIRLASAELRLAATDGERVLVRTPNGRALPDRVIVETTDDGVSIRERDGITLSFGRGRRTVQLEIEVPALAEVTVDTASGWLDGQGLRGEQHYRTASGEIGLRAGAGSIDVAAVSGDLTIELVAAAELGIKTVSGDVAIAGGRLDALRVQTTSGDVRVDSPLTGRSGHAIETLSGDVDLVADDGIRIEARTVSGDLSSELPHRSEGRMGRRTLVVGDGSIELAFRSVSGDLRVRSAAAARTDTRTPASAPSWALAPEPPIPPIPPIAPIAPIAPIPPEATWPGAGFDPFTVAPAAELRDTPAPTDGDPIDEEHMTILRSLERGEMDVATALDRLAALDAASLTDGSEPVRIDDRG